jgi:hypothetical protein
MELGLVDVGLAVARPVTIVVGPESVYSITTEVVEFVLGGRGVGGEGALERLDRLHISTGVGSLLALWECETR